MDSVFLDGWEIICICAMLCTAFSSFLLVVAVQWHWDPLYEKKKTLLESGTQNVIANKRLILNQSLKMHCTYSLVCNKKDIKSPLT